MPANSNTVANTNIYLRLKSDAVNGVFGNVSITSTGATSQNKGLPPAIIASIPVTPTTTATVNYTTGDTPNILTASALSNHSLKWYNAASGGTFTSTAFTPTTNVAGTQNYFVSQMNSSGCESPRTQITVIVSNPNNTIQAPTGLSYPSTSSYTVGSAITNLVPTSTGGSIASYAISPSLPVGFNFNATTGVISGTPSGVATITTYTITATNATGSTTTTISFVVNAAIVNIVEPQASLNAMDYALLATDTVRLKLITSAGTAPFTLILSNSANNINDTITNLKNDAPFLMRH